MSTPAMAEKMLQAIANGFSVKNHTNMSEFWDNAHPDCVFEFPYAKTNGFQPVVAGKEAIAGLFGMLVNFLPDLKLYDAKVTPLAEPGGFIVEYRGSCPAKKNYDQRYISFMKFKDNKLILFKEHWDTAEVARIMAP